MDSRFIYENFDHLLQDPKTPEYRMGLETLVDRLCSQEYYHIEYPFYMQLIPYISDAMKDMTRQTGGQMAGHGYEVALGVKKRTENFVAKTSALLHDFVEEVGDKRIREQSKFDNLPRNGTRVALQKREYENVMREMASKLGSLLHEAVCKAGGNIKYYEDASFEIQDVVKTLTRDKANYYEDIGAIIGADTSFKCRIISMHDKIEDSKNNMSTMNPTKTYWAQVAHKDTRLPSTLHRYITPHKALKSYHHNDENISLYWSMLKNKALHLFMRKGPYRTSDKVYKAYKSLIILSSFRGFKNEVQYMYDTLDNLQNGVSNYLKRNIGCGMTDACIQSKKDIERILTIFRTNQSLLTDVSSLKKILVDKHIYFNDRKSVNEMLDKLSKNMDISDIRLFMQAEHFAHHLNKFGFQKTDKLTGLGMLLGYWEEYKLDDALKKLTNVGYNSMIMAINHMATYHSHPKKVNRIRRAVEDHANIEKFTEVGDRYDGFIRKNFDPRIRKTSQYKWIKLKNRLHRTPDLDAAMLFRRIYEYFIKDPDYVMHGLGYKGIEKEGWY